MRQEENYTTVMWDIVHGVGCVETVSVIRFKEGVGKDPSELGSLEVGFDGCVFRNVITQASSQRNRVFR